MRIDESLTFAEGHDCRDADEYRETHWPISGEDRQQADRREWPAGRAEIATTEKRPPAERRTHARVGADIERCCYDTDYR